MGAWLGGTGECGGGGASDRLRQGAGHGGTVVILEAVGTVGRRVLFFDWLHL